jgi:hypothetical protein
MKYVEGGSVVFTNLCDGQYGVNINKDGYKGVELIATLTCNQQLEVVKDVEKTDPCCNGILNISAKDSKDNHILVGASVKLWKGSTLLTTLKLEKDMVSFTKLCPGDYSVSINLEGYKGIEFAEKIVCSDTIREDKTLIANIPDTCCNGTLQITARDKNDGHLLKGAYVKLYKNGVLLTKLVQEGEYVLFTKLCPGNYSVAILAEQHKAIEFVVAYACDDSIKMEKLLEPEIPQDSCCNGIVYFTPMDKNDKHILKGATVKLWKGDKLLTTLKVEGESVYFQKLCQGDYQISCLMDNYKSVEFAVKVLCNETQRLSKEMEAMAQDSCCNGVLKLFPKDAETKDILNGAYVKLFKGGKQVGQAYVEGGYAILSKLCQGEYSFSINKDGYKGVEGAFALGCNEQKEVVKEMSKATADTCCKGVLTFTLRDSTNGNPLKSVFVALYKNGQKIKYATTNEEGKAGIDGICEGNYTIKYTREGFKAVEFAIQMGCNEKKSYESYMLPIGKDSCCTAKMKLKILDMENLPLANAQVDLWIGDKHVREAVTNSEGWAVFESLCSPNTYTIQVSKEGYYSSDKFNMSYTECVLKTETVKLRKK